MATVREALTLKIYNCGVFHQQIEEALGPTLFNNPKHAMAGRWNDPEDDYPPVMAKLLWRDACVAMVAWIDRACPKAWFREIFDLEPMPTGRGDHVPIDPGEPPCQP
jgi:hypothetical protein